MTTKTKKGKAASKTAAPVKPDASLIGGVHVSASLNRNSRPDACEPYGAYMRELYVDKNGNVQAQASCGDVAFVCTKSEAKDVAAFLTSVANAA